MGPTVLPDANLIERIMQGQTDDFAILAERYLPVARAVALARTRNLDDADDIAQETLVKAYTSLHTIRNRNKFGPWIATIARNLATNTLRKRKRQDDYIRNETIPTSVRPDVARRELYAQIRQYVDELPHDQRETVLLYYFAGRKLREIAALSEITTNTAEKRLGRARTALGKRILEELMPEEDIDQQRGDLDKLMGLVAITTPPWSTVGAVGAEGTILSTTTTLVGGIIMTKKLPWAHRHSRP